MSMKVLINSIPGYPSLADLIWPDGPFYYTLWRHAFPVFFTDSYSHESEKIKLFFILLKFFYVFTFIRLLLLICATMGDSLVQSALICLWTAWIASMDEWTMKTPKPKCRLFLKIDLLTDFAALCLTDFIDWRYIHSWLVFSVQLVNCCPHGRRNYTCVLLPLYLLSDLPPPFPN